MTNNFYDILKLVKAQGTSFDTETFGLKDYHRIYSASFASWGSKVPHTLFLQPTQKDLSQASRYGREAFDIASRGKSFIGRGDFPQQFLNALDKTKFLVGHNLNYDFNAISREYKDHPLFPQIQAKFQSFTNANVDPEDLSPEHLTAVKRYKDRINPFGESKYYHGGSDAAKNYHNYKRYLSSVLNTEGKIGVLDTFSLTKMMAGMSEQAGLIEWGGRAGLGGKLEYLASALGINTSSSAHTELDTIFNQPVAETLMSDIDKIGAHLESKIAKTGNRVFAKNPYIKTISDINHVEKLGLSSDTLRIFGALSKIQTAKAKYGEYELGLSDFNDMTMLENRAAEFAQNHNKVTRFSHSGGTTYFEGTRDEIRKTIIAESKLEDAGRVFDNITNELSGKSINEVDAYFHGRRAQYNNSFFDNLGIRNTGKGRIPHVINPSASLKEAMFNQRNLKYLGIGALAIGAATMYSMMGNRKNYSPIEGLHPGDGVNKQMIQDNTDFGSPLNMKNGISKAFDFMADLGSNFIKTVKANRGLVLTAGVPGFMYGFNKGREGGGVDFSTAAGAVAFDMLDDLAIIGTPMIASRFPAINKIKPFLEHPYVSKAGMAFFGFSTGKLAGEIFASSMFSGKDDNFNTIEGLRHGGVAEVQRKRWTDFGSGYQGPNPQLEPEYNTAQDIYRYQLMRASAIGLPEEELYEKVTRPDKDMSEYVAASASAGTALHQLMQAEQASVNSNYAYEKLVVNRQAGIAGHIDEITSMGVGDIKTVSPGIFKEIQKAGKYKPQHYAQVQFYLGTSGNQHGYIKYVNRSNPNQQKTFQFDFNPRYYESLISKAERVRARVLEDISRGRLNKSSLPKTASIETLEEDNKNTETTLQMAQSIDEKRQIFKEEMKYLNSVQRGMPKYGEPKRRIDNANSNKIEQMMQSTQGLGLSIYERRNLHGVM